MDAASAVVTVPASSATASATTTPSTSNAINVNQSNNHSIQHTHTNLTHSGTNSLSATTNSSNSNSSLSNISIGGSSNSSCSSSSTSSNSSGYGSTTTTPTNNYDLQQQTTPTTTPVPTTPVAIAEPIIPVATVAAVTPFYNESITTHNLETHQLQHHPHHSQQQQLQQQQHQHQHHVLQPSHHHQLPQNHLQTNLQQQQQQQHHHQYLSRQQYYSTYDYQQPAPTHNLSGSSALAAGAAYNVGVAGPYEIASAAYGTGQYKASSLAGAINYERSSVVRSNAAAPGYNQLQQQQQQQQTELQQSKTLNQQTQQFPPVSATSKQRSSSLIGNSTSTNTSKPQAAATPFYAQPLTTSQPHSNPAPFYDNSKYKMPLEYHDTYSNPSAAATATYHQQQKYYAAAKSQLKEAAYGSPAGLNSKSVYPNTGNFFPGPATNHGLPSGSYDKYMYPHAPTTGYTAAGHLGNETPPEVSNYRKPVVANSMNSPSWPWGIDYASGNSRTIPPPASHLPTATVAPTHATYLTPNPTALARDPYYMGHEKYGMKYDKYAAPSYQQSYVSPPGSRHHLWPSTPHASNITQLNERHLLGTGPTAPPSHALHTAPYFSNNSTTGLNSRQSCCSQPYQPQSCYYPPSHPIPPRLPHNPSPSGPAPSGGYLPSQQTLGQSPHLNALTASCKYGGVMPDYGNGGKMKNSNDLYLNAHHYDNNTSPHNYGYGSAHSSQQLYASNAHQSMAHGLAPSSILTHDPLNANPASYTNDLSLATSNFDNYHTHLDTHPSPQTLAGIHSQQPPPAYAPTVAKRALLDYRKPIQPQPPPTIAEECYATLSSRDHYNQQELLNTPETTTTFGEYEAHQDNATSLSSFSHSTEVLADADKAVDESNKNLSLRDFIANWNDDEDEFQNNEELNFDQTTVIDEVLQTAPVGQEAAAAVVVREIIKTSSLDSKTNEQLSKEPQKMVENLDPQTLNDPDVNQYVNLPDIVIDIEKSNNVNNSITTPATTPTPATQPDTNTNTSLNLNDFDVEKELDELKLKKPTQQELTKDLNDIKDTNSVTTPQLSPCKNLTTQLSFEDLNLEPSNKTVLNAIPTTATRLTTNNQSSELTEHYFKDMEGYESGSSRHSNESAFEKEYETFINKITSNTSTNKNSNEKPTEADKEVDFEQNVQDFSKFYKRKRKLKEDELKTSVPETQSQKKLKTSVATKVNNSNFPQVYTKKSRNRFHKAKQPSPHRRKPLSLYYKIIHSIRRFGLHRLRRVREYMNDLKEKHLPLIKRQSIKNYTHGIAENLFNAKSLKALCIMTINTNEFRQTLMLTMAEDRGNCLEAEEKHICTDPACETCEVIKSLMEADSFEDTLIQQATETTTVKAIISTVVLCQEGTIIDNAEMISNEIENVQYSKENPFDSDAKDIEKDLNNISDIKSLVFENPNCKAEEILDNQYPVSVNKSETEFDLQNWYEKSKSPDQEHSEIPSQLVSENATSLTDQSNLNLEKAEDDENENDLSVEPFDSAEHNQFKQEELVAQAKIYDETNFNISTDNKLENSITDKDLEFATSAELNELLNTTLKSENIANEKIAVAKNQESESEDSDSSESDTDSSGSVSEDESVDDSKDSSKKSENNDKNSDTDSESDLENDDEKFNSESEESNHSQITSQKRIAASKEIHLAFDSFKLDNSALVSDSKQNEVIEHTEERKNYNQTDMELDANTDSDTEDNVIPKSPQHIVIRIKKSLKLSPNDKDSREVFISEKSLQSYAESDNHTESESESEDDETDISTTLKLGPKLQDTIEDQVTEQSETPLESEDVEILEKESEMVLTSLKKQEDFSEDLASEKLIEPHTELDDNTERDNENILEIESEMVSTSLKPIEQRSELNNSTESESEDDNFSLKESEILNSKNGDSIEDPVCENSIEPHTELANNTEGESEDVDISEKEIEMVSRSLNLSSKHEDSKGDVVTEKPIEPKTKLNDNTESDSEDDDISEKESEVVSTHLKLSPKQDDFIENQAAEELNEPYSELDDNTESESEDEDISEKDNEMVSTSLKLSSNKNSVEDYASAKSFEVDNQYESEDENISKKTADEIASPLKSTSNQEQYSEENSEKCRETKDSDANILETNSEVTTTTSELDDLNTIKSDTEYNNQIEHEYEDMSDKEIISTSYPKQADIWESSPKSSEPNFDSHTEEHQSKHETLEDHLDKETDIVVKTSALSPIPHISVDECLPQKSAPLSADAEVYMETSIINPKLESSKEQPAAEKPAHPNTKLDYCTESESEDDSDYMSRNKLELNQKLDEEVKTIPDNDHAESQSEDDDTDDEDDLQLKATINDADTITLSDSESSSDSESETDDEDMEPMEKTTTSMPVMISDDESVDNSYANEDIQKPSTCINQRSEDSLQKCESNAELTDSMIDGDKIELFTNSPKKIINEDSNLSSNTLELTQVNSIVKITEPEVTTPVITPNTNEGISAESKIWKENEVLNDTIISPEEYSSIEINDTQTINQDYSREKCISEYSNSSEDSDIEMDDKLSTKDDQEVEEKPKSHPETLDDQESLKSKDSFNNFECHNNVDVSDCESKANNDYGSVTHDISVYSPKENQQLQDSKALIEDSNTLEEKAGISSEQTTVGALSETVPEGLSENLEILADVIMNNFTKEPTNTSDNVENEDLNNIGPEPESEKPSVITGISCISEENNVQHSEDLEENLNHKVPVAKPDVTDESYIQEESTILTSETYKETPQQKLINDELIVEEFETNSNQITEETNKLESVEDHMTEDINTETITEETDLEKTHIESQASIDKPITEDRENICQTESERDNNVTIIESIIEKSETSTETTIENSGLPLDINNDSSDSEEVVEQKETNAEFVTERSDTMLKTSTQMELTDEYIAKESEIISKPLTAESRDIQSPKCLNECIEVISATATEIISKPLTEESTDIQSPKCLKECVEIISASATKELVSISQDTDILEKASIHILDKSENIFGSNKIFDDHMINEPETLSNSTADEITFDHMSARREIEATAKISEEITEKSELGEEHTSGTSDVFEENGEQTNESLHTWEDADIFKEVLQVELGTSKESFDNNICNDESIAKETETVTVKDLTDILKKEEHATIPEVIVQQVESFGETIKTNVDIVETACDQIESTIKAYETEDKTETSEYYKESASPVHQYLSKSEVIVESTNKSNEVINEMSTCNAEESGTGHQCQSNTEVAAEKPVELIEDRRETSECCAEDSGAVHESLAKYGAVAELETSWVEEKTGSEKESSAVHHSQHNSEVVIANIADKFKSSESFEEETQTLSKHDELETLKSQADEISTPEVQAKNPECSLKEISSERVLDNSNITKNVNEIPPNFEPESIDNQQMLPKDDELVTEKFPVDEEAPAENQMENLEPSFNDSLRENISNRKADEEPSAEAQIETLAEPSSKDSLTENLINKDSNTQEDLSGDFLGFKQQCSFEDESEDFHGFEDLEEVTRIRQEIENLNDDSAANDGFLNYASLNRDRHKSSTNSLADSTSSEINELEALEKELSQHQTEIAVADDDEDKETDKDLQTETVNVVSTNDIEHIKQMLESDEELQQDESDHCDRVAGDEGKTDKELLVENKDKSVECSKMNTKDILSSVNSIIPKLSDLCRAALNSSLNSNSNLAQHTEAPTILVERELSVEEALAEMYRQAGVLLSDPEDCDNDIAPSGDEEAHDVLLINLQEILNSDNNDVYVLQCDMNENVLNVVQQTTEAGRPAPADNDTVDNAERVNTVQFIGILDTQSTEPQIHIISSDSESEVIILSDDESDFSYRPFIARPERITIPFINDNDINDSDSLSDISTIHHEEIVPDNLNKFLQEEFYKYLHEKYVQRNISKYYHANRVLKKYKKRFVKTKRQ